MLPKSRSNILANGLTNHSSIYFLNPSTSLNSSKGSGTGSSFVAVCDNSSIDDIKDVWSSREGRVIETAVDNEGCVFL